MNRERLQTYRALLNERLWLEEQLEIIEARITSPKVQRLTGMPPSGSRGYNDNELVAVHLDLCAAYKEKLKSLAAEQLAIEEAVAALPQIHRAIIRLYYLEGLTWSKVCQEINYSWSQTHRKHREALRMLREKETTHKCD